VGFGPVIEPGIRIRVFALCAIADHKRIWARKAGGALLIAAVILAISNSRAHSMQYQRVPLEDKKVIIALRGPIVGGDYQRLLSFLAGMPPDDRIMGLALDSPGGNVFEAENMAVRIISSSSIAVFVPSGSECSSACFLLFAASPRKFAAPDAVFAVHGVSENGKENLGTLGLTTAFARDLAQFDVPPAIIGKLVATPAERHVWLTPGDLQSMGVTVLKEETASSAPVQSQPAAPPLALAPPGIPGSPAEPSAFQQGLADRGAWEGWYQAQTGWYHLGAANWAAVRSTSAAKNACSADHLRKARPEAADNDVSDWLAGCIAARDRLAAPDRRRLTEPEYKAGWNSYSVPITGQPDNSAHLCLQPDCKPLARGELGISEQRELPDTLRNVPCKPPTSTCASDECRCGASP
jgi:hypothetical protein